MAQGKRTFFIGKINVVNGVERLERQGKKAGRENQEGTGGHPLGKEKGKGKFRRVDRRTEEEKRRIDRQTTLIRRKEEIGIRHRRDKQKGSSRQRKHVD